MCSEDENERDELVCLLSKEQSENIKLRAENQKLNELNSELEDDLARALRDVEMFEELAAKP